ncbi:MAG: hypothetical protein ACJ77K_19585 [Bacteroidia bacterium]
MKNPKILVSFVDRILHVKFLNKAVISADDLHEFYGFGVKEANGKKYCVIFEAEGHYDVTEECIELMTNNPYNVQLLAKAYVINSLEAETKTKLHIRFDRPDLKPVSFKRYEEGRKWLNNVLLLHDANMSHLLNK